MLLTVEGLPLAVAITGAIQHDFILVEPVLGGCPRVRVKIADNHAAARESSALTSTYDNQRVRRHLLRREITARIARIGVDSGEGLDRYR